MKNAIFSRPYLVRLRLCDRLVSLLSVCDVMYCG